MKSKILYIFFFILSIVSSIFIGHENPEIVINAKKNVNFFLKKIGLSDSFVPGNKIVLKESIQSKQTKFETFSANSFDLIYSKIISIEGRSAAILIEGENGNADYNFYTQSGLFFSKKNKKELSLPINFTTEQDGGIKSVFKIKDKIFVLLSQIKGACHFASIINITEGIKILDSKCIPDGKNVNFAGLGGGYVFKDESIILSIGVPTHISDEIDLLSQNKKSIFGKMLSFNISELQENKSLYNFYTIGHRNPQGLVKFKNRIFSIEHGPQGGDELNEIKKDYNYGWPVASYGTRYNDGKSFARSHKRLNFKEPIFTFLPAVAPSSLTTCPKNLKEYYEDKICLMGLSLKEMSILIILMTEDGKSVLNVEKIFLEKRMRHFGLNEKSEIYFDKDGYFYFSSDDDGLYKGKFTSFR